MKWQVWVPLFLIIGLLLPSVIVGEVIYGWSRKQQYDDLEGFESLILQIRKNLSLQLWYTNTSNKVILIVHGHNDHSGIMNTRYGKLFRNLGYDLVFIDLRNHGKSDRDKPVTLGVKESRDVAAALEWVSQKGWEEIILFGTSMGGIAALLGQYTTQIADKVVLDSIFLDFMDVLNGNFKKNHLPQPWRWIVINYLVKIRFGNEPQPNITSILTEQKKPYLILHGREDKESSVEIISTIDGLENPNIETSIIENAEHSRLFLHEKYTETIQDFLELE